MSVEGQALRVLIALPTTDQIVRSATAITVASIVKHLERRGIEVDLHNIDSAEIVTARDMFANMVLYSDTWNALLFIDSDMSFDPEIVLRMVDLGQEVTAVAYTRRQLDLDAFVQAVRGGTDPSRARALASNFNFRPSWTEGEVRLEIRDGFCAGAAVGMGCTLIKKSALQAMIDAKVVQPRLDLDAGPGRTCWSFFGILDQNGHRLGEDYSFCYRWTEQMGRKLWVCVDQEIAHVGSFDYKARYLDLLELTAGAG